MPQKLLVYTCLLLLLCCWAPALAQRNIQLNGTILQADKQTPVEGAAILKLGSNTHTASDSTGAFRLQMQDTDTLLIRAVGYKPLLYLPQKLPVSELRVTIVMHEDSVMLGVVEVTNRPSAEMIRRATRNMKVQDPNYTKRPGYNAALEPPPPPPAPPPTIIFNPISAFSKEGKQVRRVHQLRKKAQQEEAEKTEQQRLKEEEEKRKKAKADYNRFFKDNTGYQ